MGGRSDVRHDETLTAQQKASAATQAAQRSIEIDPGGYQRAQGQWVSRKTAEHLLQIDVAVRLDGAAGNRRKRSRRGIADYTQCSKGKTRFGGIGGRDVAFHVDGRGAGLGMEYRLAGLPNHDLLDTGKPGADHLLTAEAGAIDQFLTKRKACLPSRLTIHDFRGDHDVSGLQRWVEAAGDPEADHASHRRRIEPREKRPQLPGIAAAANDGHAGARSDAGFLNQTGHNQYRPRVKGIAHGYVNRRPQIHIPTPTTLLLVLLKFRYRASAQSGKNLA